MFKELSDKDVVEVVLKCPLMDKQKDEIVFSKIQPANGIYLLVEGVLRKEFDKDNSFLLYLGSVLGAHSIFNIDQAYDASIRCESNCKLLFIRTEIIMRFLNKYQHFEKNIAIMCFSHFLESQKKKSKTVEVY